MTIKASEIELFKELSEFELGGLYCDFHNDLKYSKIAFQNNCLTIVFKKIADGSSVAVQFINTTLEKFEFLDFGELSDLTIDLMYRGPVREQWTNG
jgi:hypothetical protein